MEVISLLIPFLLIGFFSAMFSSLTGVAISMLIVPAILYMGATPVDVVTFMLTFILYYNLTFETQDVRMNFKELTFFSGKKIILPIVLTVICVVVAPLIAIVLFILFFMLELFAFCYKKLNEANRPTVKEIIVHAVISSVFCGIGVGLVRFMPQNYFFLPVGAAILLVTAFAWYAGNHRDSFKGTWNIIWDFLALFMGLFGIEETNYPKGLLRSYNCKLDYLRSLIIMTASFVGLIISFVLFNTFSLPALVSAIGAAIAVRFFGVYEFTKNGSFSYLAIALAILVVLSLYLVAPASTGIVGMEDLFK